MTCFEHLAMPPLPKQPALQVSIKLNKENAIQCNPLARIDLGETRLPASDTQILLDGHNLVAALFVLQSPGAIVPSIQAISASNSPKISSVKKIAG